MITRRSLHRDVPSREGSGQAGSLTPPSRLTTSVCAQRGSVASSRRTSDEAPISSIRSFRVSYTAPDLSRWKGAPPSNMYLQEQDEEEEWDNK